MKVLARVIPILLGIGVVSALAASLASSSDQGHQVPLPAAPPPQKTVLSWTTLQAPESHPDVGFDFNPPGPATPTISADQAIQIVAQSGDETPATTEQAILAIVPAGGTFSQDTLVWIVRFEGACISIHGRFIPDRSPGLTLAGVECGRQFDVIVDATTGQDIVSYFD